MPSGTLESPFSISRVRALARSSTLHKDAEKTGFGNNYVRISVRPVHANTAIHDPFSFRFEIVIARLMR